MNLKSHLTALHEQGVHAVLAQFTDLWGTPKGKLVPLQHLADLVHTGAGFAGPSIWGTGLPLGTEVSEQVLALLRLEWSQWQGHISDWELARYAQRA